MIMLQDHVQQFMKKFTERRFRALFGLGSEEANLVYQHISGCSPEHLLWGLHFLFCYPTNSAGSCFSGADEKTWAKQTKRVIILLDQLLPEVSSVALPFLSSNLEKLNLEDRWEDWDYFNPSCIVDGSDIPILEPESTTWGEKTAFFSHKTGGPTLRYMILVSVATKRFIWCSDAFPGGTSEARIVLETVWDRFLPGERILGDSLFSAPAYMHVFTTPLRATDQETYHRLSSMRAAVEHSFEQLKNFKIATTRFRSTDYHFHEICIRLLCKILNLTRK